MNLEVELRRKHGFTRHTACSQCVTKHAYREKVVKLETPTHLYMQILFDTNIPTMKHIVNDMKVSQNIRRTFNVALSSAPHGNLGPTLYWHQIPKELLQTTEYSLYVTFMGRREGSVCLESQQCKPVCIVDIDIPVAMLKSTTASTPFCSGSQEASLTLQYLKYQQKYANVKCIYIYGRGRI